MLPQLREVSNYLFDERGKQIRPMLVYLTARACNYHTDPKKESKLTEGQSAIGVISEMIHTASLIHDDVIDAAHIRRGKPTINSVWGQKKAILTGDYILSRATVALSKLRNERVVIVLSQVLDDLVQGEFMQLGSKEDRGERFNHYIKKTFRKTASLMACSCKAVAILADPLNQFLHDVAFNFGMHFGISFQLIDDLLDFIASDDVMGKPTSTDLRLGLATAPVLYACDRFPELDAMIMRRFTQSGDVQRAREIVDQSDGMDQTKRLACFHRDEAIRFISQLGESMERNALIQLSDDVVTRHK
ncbi:uncharacterized protein TRIADDRAFT_20625 [Trichoplax adhaerens]|uniref:Decaprenyl-diphosphate synthase subunit 1 n=1 Tax=Trichoplax adhaerens TaxID=10228 RepID=B3RQ63_TRIAD|nr:hypothetical protein TRIADDRAFT_20625 [Trichoplax adhaerens]EDV27766.1 hypothetical protein TRIADDRAFT_20625 [Trichoplax adhaerens]|eukprot:XP_002109600.1 hypothetical protein TRIADDRAFT_20625 [Trichoplax adhaerens]